MNNQEKLFIAKQAAAQRAIKLMQQGGGKGRKFFDDLMSRQTSDTVGTNFGSVQPSMRANWNQAHLLNGLQPPNPGSGRQAAIQLLKDLLKRTKGKAPNPGYGKIDDYQAMMRDMPMIRDNRGGIGDAGPKIFDIDELLKRVR